MDSDAALMQQHAASGMEWSRSTEGKAVAMKMQGAHVLAVFKQTKKAHLVSEGSCMNWPSFL